MLIILLSFIESLAMCVSLNPKPYIATTAHIDLNPVEFNYCPFKISLNKCNGSCNTIDDLSTKYMFRIKKDVNFKVFNIITKIY